MDIWARPTEQHGAEVDLRVHVVRIPLLGAQESLKCPLQPGKTWGGSRKINRARWEAA